MPYELLEVMTSSGLYSSSSAEIALTFVSVLSLMLANILVRSGGIDMLANTLADDEGLFKTYGKTRLL